MDEDRLRLGYTDGWDSNLPAATDIEYRRGYHLGKDARAYAQHEWDAVHQAKPEEGRE